ncbi:MAG: hypothetical protein M3O87_07400, partial [Candidatus Dormibacteraeota bacterium]|nr:hypothetical protein [Candidatus Dormibacteraeota bacterium]
TGRPASGVGLDEVAPPDGCADVVADGVAWTALDDELDPPIVQPPSTAASVSRETSRGTT